MNLCLTLSMLKLILPKAKELKDFRKPSKPCHVGIHLNALKEYYQMSTHVPGFQSFFRYFWIFLYWSISHQQNKAEFLSYWHTSINDSENTCQLEL